MHKPTILCVDDEQIVLTSLKSQLKRQFGMKYAIETVESGDQAFEIFQELMEDGVHVPVIISDQIMPGMKGDEFLIKVNGIQKKIKKILLTGQASPEAVGNAVNNANLYRYISKPWDIEDLNLTVNEAILSFFQEEKLEKAEKAKEELLNQLKEANESLEEKVKSRTIALENQHKLLEHKNKETVSSINYASMIQEAILPSEEELKKTIPNSFVLYQPKDIVSGDFYWMHEDTEGFYLVVADSTGHGVPGAFMSLIGASLLNESVRRSHIKPPNEIFNYSRSEIIRRLKQGEGKQNDGIDASIIYVNKTTLKAEVAGAYNPSYILRLEGKELRTTTGEKLDPDMTLNGVSLYAIGANRFPIGYHLRYQEPFQQVAIQLEKGDEIYMTSDGFIDQFSEAEGKKFMKKRFKKLLTSLFDKPSQEKETTLSKTLKAWKGNIDQTDDICLAGFKL